MMDEVQAMTHAGETVGRAMGTGLRTLRRGAVGVSHTGAQAAAHAATAAERKLAQSAHDMAKDLAARTDTTRRRWPWLLALLGIAAVAGTAVALRRRSSTEPALIDEPAESGSDKQRITGNGSAPQPRVEHKELDHKN